MASAQESMEWEKATGVWERGAVSTWASYEVYAEAWGVLLQALINAKKPSFHQAQKFSSMWRSSQRSQLINPQMPCVCSQQGMEEIEWIYIKYYQTTEVVEGPINQLLCHLCHHCSHKTSEEDSTLVCKSTLMKYLTDVKVTFRDPILSRTSKKAT